MKRQKQKAQLPDVFLVFSLSVSRWWRQVSKIEKNYKLGNGTKYHAFAALKL